MTTIIDQMLKQYETNTIYDKRNALKEVLQEMVLCGLSRAGFFKKVAFYGGTALRIFYGLDRFSEALDFSLIKKDENFELSSYFPVLEKELGSFGLKLEIEGKVKGIDTSIKSAFVKGNTKEQFLVFYGDHLGKGLHNNERTKIKFEVDINPPSFAEYEHQYRLLPMPYEVRLYARSSLFAGKIHALLCRTWKHRVKGRDLYDYVFFLSQSTPVNIKHLRSRLIQTGHLSEGDEFLLEDLKSRLVTHFKSIDYNQAKEDVLPFIKDVGVLDIWSSDFFIQITDKLISDAR